MKTSKFTLYEFCAETGRRDLLEQWDDRNLPLTPMSVGYGSKQKVWWHCTVWWICDQGHEWSTPVARRVQAKCPYCTNRKVMPGFNDLETINPDAAAMWHNELNGDLKPSQVTPGARTRVWWQCKFGHVWKAKVYSVNHGSRCPVCAGVVKRGTHYNSASEVNRQTNTTR